MTSSYNDIRELNILQKEVEAVINKKKEKRLKELERFIKQESIPTEVVENKTHSVKNKEIECTCGYTFYEHLGECPKCGENTVYILKHHQQKKM